MIPVGKWRWPLVVGLPLIGGGLLVWRGIVRLNYSGQALLTYSGVSQTMDIDANVFQAHPNANIVFGKVAGHPLQVSVRGQGASPDDVGLRLKQVGQIWAEQSLTRQRVEFRKSRNAYQKQVTELESNLNQQIQDRQRLLAGPKKNTPRANLVSRIEALKARRALLIEHYPTHTDIPVLGRQIQDLVSQMARPSAPVRGKVSDFDKQINETKLRKDYFARRLQEAIQAEIAVKPLWTLLEPIAQPKWPDRVEGWPMGSGVMMVLFAAAFALFRGERRTRDAVHAAGLWKPEVPELAKLPDAPVQLEVVSPESTLSDPLTETAALLYAKWVEVSKVLYAPAPEPPQGILDSVSPLLEETIAFLPTGHDVLARYLARSVTPGDLAAHVARTVLMTLTGAEEAGVSQEHRLAMALAALFHDLAVVPRPLAVQEDAGSEVGRLSASVLRRIPGLESGLLVMVEEILIGMDEFKLETWQNVANGSNLEPLSKVLREIDRFEKVMQKQKSRLDRRVANQ